MSFTPDEVRSAIRAAVDCLPAKDGSEGAAEELARAIVSMSQADLHNSPRADLRRTNEAGIEKDLQSIRLHASKIQGLIAEIRPQTRQRLWDAPSYVDENGRQVRADINRLFSSLTQDLAVLIKISEIVKPDRDNAAKTRGRTDDLRSSAATKVTAFYYRQITGCQPSRSKVDGGFLPLLQAVFDVLLIDRNVDRAARDYLTRLRTKSEN